MSSSLLSDLNPEQQKAVTHGSGPLLILAGAGSGKTRCLTYRTAWLTAEQLVDPSRIVLLTFTNKAAGEMKGRVKQLLTGQRSNVKGQMLPWAGTFHSWCALLLRKHAGLAGLRQEWLIYDEDDKQSLLKEVIEDLDLSKGRFKPRPVGAVISEAKNELIGAIEYPQFAKGEWYQGVARIYLEYQRRLKKFGGLDFDDLLVEAIRLFERQQELLARYQEQIQHLLVDEYQDTNTAQYRLTKLLVGRHQNLTAVGDFSQAIYQFRGANYRNLLTLKRDFPELTTLSLTKNYRSHQAILDAAHRVIANNTQHPVLKLWTDRKSAGRVKLHVAMTERDEASFVVDRVQEDRVRSNGENRFSDWAVLYRTNAQSRVFEEAMLMAGVPYVLVGGIQFYRRVEIKDCLAYLRLLFNPDDEVSETRALKLGKKRYAGFRDYVSKIGRGKIKGGKTILPTTRELLEGVLKATRYYERFDEEDPEDLTRIENVKELLSVAEMYPSLTRFLEQVALVEREALVKKENQDVVTLMTLHAAKGLEFPNVVIAGAEEGLLPHSRSAGNKEELEEERRLMYVGITRAKDRLYLIYTRSRLVFGSRGVCVPSRFIGEIGEEMLERV